MINVIVRFMFAVIRYLGLLYLVIIFCRTVFNCF